MFPDDGTLLQRACFSVIHDMVGWADVFMVLLLHERCVANTQLNVI